MANFYRPSGRGKHPAVIVVGGSLPAGLKNTAAVEAAAIPVERINGPVLLISAGDDKVWPSSAMAAQVAQSLEKNRFRFPVEHLRYDKAGHAISGPTTVPRGRPLGCASRTGHGRDRARKRLGQGGRVDEDDQLPETRAEKLSSPKVHRRRLQEWYTLPTC